MEAKQKVVGYIKQTLRHKSSSIARKNETYPHAPQPKKKKERKEEKQYSPELPKTATRNQNNKIRRASQIQRPLIKNRESEFEVGRYVFRADGTKQDNERKKRRNKSSFSCFLFPRLLSFFLSRDKMSPYFSPL